MSRVSRDGQSTLHNPERSGVNGSAVNGLQQCEYKDPKTRFNEANVIIGKFYTKSLTVTDQENPDSNEINFVLPALFLYGGLPDEIILNILSFLDFYSLYMLWRYREDRVIDDRKKFVKEKKKISTISDPFVRKKKLEELEEKYQTKELSWLMRVINSLDIKPVLKSEFIRNAPLAYISDDILDSLPLHKLFRLLFKFSIDGIFKSPENNTERHRLLANTTLSISREPFLFSPFDTREDENKRNVLSTSQYVGYQIMSSPEYRERLWAHNPRLQQLNPFTVLAMHGEAWETRFAIMQRYNNAIFHSIIPSIKVGLVETPIPMRFLLLALIGADIKYIMDNPQIALADEMTLDQAIERLYEFYFCFEPNNSFTSFYLLDFGLDFPSMTYILKLLRGKPYRISLGCLLARRYLLKQAGVGDNPLQATPAEIALLAHEDPDIIFDLFDDNDVRRDANNQIILHNNFTQADAVDQFKTFWDKYFDFMLYNKQFIKCYFSLLKNTFDSILLSAIELQTNKIKDICKYLCQYAKKRLKNLDDTVCINLYDFLFQYEALVQPTYRLSYNLWTDKANQLSMKLYYLGKHVQKLPAHLRQPVIIICQVGLGLFSKKKLYFESPEDKRSKVPYLTFFDKLFGKDLFESVGQANKAASDEFASSVEILNIVLNNANPGENKSLTLFKFILFSITDEVLISLLFDKLVAYAQAQFVNDKKRLKFYKQMLGDLYAMDRYMHQMDYHSQRPKSVAVIKAVKLRNLSWVISTFYQQRQSIFESILEEISQKLFLRSGYKEFAAVLPVLKDKDVLLRFFSYLSRMKNDHLLYYFQYLLLSFLPSDAVFINAINNEDFLKCYLNQFLQCYDARGAFDMTYCEVSPPSSRVCYDILSQGLNAMLRTMKMNTRSCQCLINLYVSCLKLLTQSFQSRYPYTINSERFQFFYTKFIVLFKELPLMQILTLLHDDEPLIKDIAIMLSYIRTKQQSSYVSICALPFFASFNRFLLENSSNDFVTALRNMIRVLRQQEIKRIKGEQFDQRRKSAFELHYESEHKEADEEDVRSAVSVSVHSSSLFPINPAASGFEESRSDAEQSAAADMQEDLPEPEQAASGGSGLLAII